MQRIAKSSTQDVAGDKHDSRRNVVRILLTNDDGVDAPGVQAVYQALKGRYQVVLVAPEAARSGASQGFTFGRPYWVSQRADDVYACSGSPVDCVIFGLAELGPFDLVVSGMNHGANVAWDMWYSGTIGAGWEAARRGVRTVTLSLNVLPDAYDPHLTYHYAQAAETFAAYGRQGFLDTLEPGTVVNVNFPNDPLKLSAPPQLAVPGHYPFNRQTLICDPIGNGRWAVRVEHRSQNLLRSAQEPQSDGALVQKAPAITVLSTDWYQKPVEQYARLEQWIGQHF